MSKQPDYNKYGIQRLKKILLNTILTSTTIVMSTRYFKVRLKHLVIIKIKEKPFCYSLFLFIC